jgi:hypothetical protein
MDPAPGGPKYMGPTDPDPQHWFCLCIMISFDASPEEGKADKGEAEPDENGHKAGQGRVPVTVAARLFLGQENRSNISDC